MDFHFVKLTHAGTYLTMVDLKQKPRFVCFADKSTGGKYIDYASEFRSKTRIWPCLDMSRDTRKLEMGIEETAPYGRPDQIKKYLDLETFDFGSLDKIANRANVSYFCITTFDVVYNDAESETMNMSGQEMDGNADLGEYSEWLIDLKTK